MSGRMEPAGPENRRTIPSVCDWRSVWTLARFVVYAIAAPEAFNADRWMRNRCRSALRLPAADRAD